MNNPLLHNILEAILLSCEQPIHIDEIIKKLPEFNVTEINTSLTNIGKKNSLYKLEQHNHYLSLRLKSKYYTYVQRFHQNLNQVESLEVNNLVYQIIASIIMYQPISFNTLEQKIGRHIDQNIIEYLLSKKLIQSKYSAILQEEFYSSTKQLLTHFNLSSLIELERKITNVLL